MNNSEYDALVIGAGVAGQEAALNLANMNFKVLLVEKDKSIGGTMVQLSKVFPTLDCAACITTPKMSETARHPNITLMTYSEVKGIERNEGDFHTTILKHPRFVNEDACTGCQECEFACPVVKEDHYNYGLSGRKVAYVPFSLANPRIASIERNNETAPCIATCPGGVKAYGYVSLVRAGLYDEAMKLHLEDIPLPGSLGRACYAPCEDECTRKEKEGSVAIRRIKRYFSDYYYDKHEEPEVPAIENKTGKKVAVVGSGPSGLTAAYHLAQNGHSVKIFEAAGELGGMLKSAIPSFRLPNEIVDRDIQHITALGVDYELNKNIDNLQELKDQGFDSVYVSVGTHETVKFDCKGKDLDGVWCCLEFLKGVNSGERYDLTGKTVMVFGGGNVAMDSARTALRLNAEKVMIIYRRSREQMPAADIEIKEAEEEGVEFQFLKNPVEFLGDNNTLESVKCIEMKLGEPDESGRRRPVTIEGSEHVMNVDVAIVSIGLLPSASPFSGQIKLTRRGNIDVHPETLQSSEPWIFSGGDVVTGASSIIEAAGQGKRAAYFIDKYLAGEKDLTQFVFDHRLPPASKEEVLARTEERESAMPVVSYERAPKERIKDFEEIEATYSEKEVLESASRCLDCGNCRECHQCVEACPADAIDFAQMEQEITTTVKSVVMAPGFKLFPPEKKHEYGYGKYKNVIHSMEMDRLLAPTRPFHDILRPLDGKKPDNIAYVLCTGSRDCSVDNPICSQICCMYSIKQGQLLMGALPLADITVYYIDIRAFGKGFEEFYNQGQEMGVEFVKGKIAKITEKDDGSGDLILRYENIENGGIQEAEHDMVVLSVGVLPNTDVAKIFNGEKLQMDPFNYIGQMDEMLSPAKTNLEGVFVAGSASGPMDIPDSILSAGAASAESASYIRKLNHKQGIL
ncbi:MAG: FAD-dependent oxidoreductase [Bacteroidales bacterium]